MNSLTRVLGPAPSELPFEELLEKLSLERDRMRRNLIWFQNNNAQRKPKKAAPKAKAGGGRAPKLSTLAKRAELSPELLAQALEELKKEKGLAQ